MFNLLGVLSINHQCLVELFSIHLFNVQFGIETHLKMLDL